MHIFPCCLYPELQGEPRDLYCYPNASHLSKAFSPPAPSLATQASLAQSRSYCCYELFPICSPSIKYLSFIQAVVCVLQHSMGANADSSVNPTSPGNAYFKLSISLHTLMTRTPHLFHFFIR